MASFIVFIVFLLVSELDAGLMRVRSSYLGPPGLGKPQNVQIRNQGITGLSLGRRDRSAVTTSQQDHQASDWLFIISFSSYRSSSICRCCSLISWRKHFIKRPCLCGAFEIRPYDKVEKRNRLTDSHISSCTYNHPPLTSQRNRRSCVARAKLADTL